VKHLLLSTENSHVFEQYCRKLEPKAEMKK